MFYKPSKMMISGCQMWPVGYQFETANFSSTPFLWTWRPHGHSEAKKALPKLMEQVYGGAKTQTSFSDPHPQAFPNTKYRRLIRRIQQAWKQSQGV